MFKNKNKNYYFIISFIVIISFSVQADDMHGIKQGTNKQKNYEMINLTAGQVGILDNEKNVARYGIEYRFLPFNGPYNFSLIPAIGFAFAKDNARYIYADIRHDFYISSHWLLIPSFGLGSFRDSHNIKLGNTLEFRSGIELAFQFKNNIRVGLAIFHLSNAGISNENPGTEALVFSVCFPLM